ncbi:MAG: AMP-dependent synthetase/ligase [Saccharofermentanales bacterium]
MQIVKGKQYFKIREFRDLREMFLQSLDLYKDSNAFVFRKTPKDDPESRTYKEFYQETQSFGTALIAAGLESQKIAIIGENSYSWCVSYFSVICGAGVAVPLDRLLPEEEILSLLDRGEVSAVVYDGAFHETMKKAASMYPGIRAFYCMNDFKAAEFAADFAAVTNESGFPAQNGYFVKADDLMAYGKFLLEHGDSRYKNAKIDPEAMMSLLFTSGTTSQSKAVMLSHKNICADIKALAGVEYFAPHTKVLSVLPLHHTFENTCGFVGGFYFGFMIHECDGLRYIQKNMEEFKIDCLIGVPLLFESFYYKIKDGIKKQGKEKTVKTAIKISNILRKIGLDLRKKLFKDITEKFGGEFKIGICGAAPIDPEIIKFFDGIGVKILQGYGLTETSPVAAGCNAKVFVPGSVGHPLTGVEIAIDNESPGMEGEILVRGDIVMIGYYKNEAATREVIDDERWFHTGDIGRIDPKTNCLYITGRIKSMIVLKNGKKIFPEEIEHLLGQFDIIKESLVWGEIEESGDVDVWAKVVIDKEKLESQDGINDEKGIKEKMDQIIREVNKKMPSFKSIKYFIFGEKEMEKTTTKKVKRMIELASIRDILSKNSMKIKEVTGRNIDALKRMIVPEKPKPPENLENPETKDPPPDKK